jgi:hypothetical protein
VRRGRGLDGLALAALAAAVGVVWAVRFIAPARVFNFASADLFLYFLPMTRTVYGALASGRVPLWNPDQFCGTPLLATLQVGTFYPPHLLYLFLPMPGAMAVSAVLHLLAATGFAYALARALELEVPAAAVAGIAFGLSGCLLAASFFPNYQEASAWLPAGLLALGQLARRAAAGRPIGSGWLLLWCAAEAFPMLAGHAQLWLLFNYAWAAAVIYLAAAAAFHGGRGAALRFLLVVGAGAVLGLALTAVQLLPTLELTLASVRPPKAMTWAEVVPYGSFPTVHLRASLVPPRTLTPDYLGLVAVLLAPAGLFARGRRTLALALAAGGGAIFLVLLGDITPLHRLYFILPGLAAFRFPVRMQVVVLLAVAMLAALGMHEIARALRHDRPARRPAALAGTAAAALAAALLTHAGEPPYAPLVAFVLLAAAAFAPAGRTAAAVLPYCLALLIGADQFIAARNPTLTPYHAAGAALFDRHPALAELVRARRPARFLVLGSGFDPDLHAKSGMRWQAPRPDDYEPFALARVSDFLSVGDEDLPPLRVARRFIGLVRDLPRSFMDLAGVATVVVGTPRPPLAHPEETVRGLVPRGHLPSTLESGTPPPGPTIYDNPSALPRAFTVSAWRVESDPRAMLEAMRQPDFPARGVALLEEAPPSLAPSASDATAPATADIRSYQPEDVVIETRVERPSLLVLTDTYYPGWLATVDGVSAPLLRADFLYRAVPLQPGAHEVRFAYRPRSFRIGAAISVAALFIMVLGLALGGVRAWRGARHSM